LALNGRVKVPPLHLPFLKIAEKAVRWMAAEEQPVLLRS
jgi:hypothetical protein